MQRANEKGLQYLKAEDWDHAIAAFEDALRYVPNNATVKANLVKAHEGARKKKEFEEKKREAINSVKGITRTEPTYNLKGVDTIKDNSVGAFGLKGVGNTGIKDIGPEKNTREVSTAWKQVHCATEISGFAFSAAAKGDVNEAQYLASEAISALSGHSMGVTCSEAPPMPKLSNRRPQVPAQLVPQYQAALNTTVEQAKKIRAAQAALDELKREEAEARAKKPQVPSATRPPVKTQDEQVAKAIAEQKAFQAQEQKKIDEIIKQQREKQRALEEAMAALRRAQALINSQNSGQP